MAPVIVRVAVAVSEDGKWWAVGAHDRSDADAERFLREQSGSHVVVHTLEIPPEAPIAHEDSLTNMLM